MIERTPNIRRRTMQPLPSRKKHLLLALSFLTVIIAGSYVLTDIFGNENDAEVKGIVDVAAMPLPPASDTLDGNSEALPDLLAGDVPENVNPTEIVKPQLDALGNPVKSPPPSTPSAPPSPSQPETVSGPRTITINGKPINQDSQALVPAPISGLTKTSTYGRIPAISAAGMTPLSAYKRPFTSTAANTRPVSVIIGGLGVNRGLTNQAINELPADVTLSFAAHAPGLQNWINQARAKGHEVLIELPMESASFNPSEPGADRTLMASQNIAANGRNLDWLLSRAQGYFGVTNYNGDRFLTRADVAAPILDRLSQSGLSFVFDGSLNAPSLAALSTSAKLPFAKGYNLIDPRQDRAVIQSELSRLSAQAQNSAGTIGVGFAYPETITEVSKWTRELGGQGLRLAPASSALR